MARYPYFADIMNAIKVMHSNHGKGDIKHIRKFGDGRLELDAFCTSCRPHTARGRIVNNANGTQTIRIYGRQLTVMIIPGGAAQ